MKPPKRDFAAISGSILKHPQVAAQDDADRKQDRSTSFKLRHDLREGLDRNVFWEGKGSSLQSVLNDALAYYLANHPKASKRANKPTPDENPDEE